MNNHRHSTVRPRGTPPVAFKVLLIASCSIILLAASAFSLEKNDILDERDIERLFQCADSCDTDCIEGYLDGGVSPDIKEKTDIGEFPLIYHAVSANCKNVIEILIEHGANVNSLDREGRTPLHIAVYYSLEGIVRILLRNGADINAEDNSGQTPLCIAAHNAWWEEGYRDFCKERAKKYQR